MRKYLTAACALALAAPALAQPPAHDPRNEDFAEALPDRRDIERTAMVLDRLVGALLDIPIGPIVAAVDPLGRGPYRATDRLRDLSDDPNVEERLRGSIRGTTAGIGAMTEAMAAMTPVLRAAIQDVRQRMEEAMSAPRRD